MRKSYALFDFDGTLIPGDSIVLFCRYAARRGLCKKTALLSGAWHAALYALRLESARDSKAHALGFLRGKTEKEIDSLCEDFYRRELRPLLRRRGVEKLRWHRRRGDAVLLLTASPSFYLRPFAREFGIEEVIGTRMDVKDGVYTGLISGDNCRGLQKPLRLAEYLAAKGDRLDYDSSYAYGDSYGDLETLRLCAHRAAVDPKRRLRRAMKGDGDAQTLCW